MNLSSSDIIWNRLLSVFSILLVSEDSEKEDGDNEENEEDKGLPCFHFFFRDLCFLGIGDDFSGKDN